MGLPTFTVEGKVDLKDGDILKVHAGDLELYILFSDGKFTVSNESSSPPSVVEVLDDGTFALIEGVVE
jgi:hypothetical protein